MALSRLKKFHDFIIYPFTLERLKKLSNAKNLQPRLDEEKRIQAIELQTQEKYNFL